MLIRHIPRRRRPIAEDMITFMLIVFILLMAGIALPERASAQMFEKAWSFQQRDRAGIAVIQKQVESGLYSRSGNSTGAVVSGGQAAGNTLLICGGGQGTSSSTANSSCIILNNSTGQLSIGQDSVGDQNANSQTQSQTSIDQVENILSQNTDPSSLPGTGGGAE